MDASPETTAVPTIEKNSEEYPAYRRQLGIEYEETMNRLRDIVARIAEDRFSSEGTYNSFSAWSNVDGWVVRVRINCDKIQSASKAP